VTKNLHYYDLREVKCETDVEVTNASSVALC